MHTGKGVGEGALICVSVDTWAAKLELIAL